MTYQPSVARTALALVVLLALLAASASQALAETASTRPDPGDPVLATGQKERFGEGAEQVAGLSKEEIEIGRAHV